jgi:FtsH-binding integral membrane protein
MKKVYRKYGIALALLMVFALLKVTLVPNLQHTALYRPLKDGITTLGWVLVIYMGFWYLERRRWEKATPEERRDMERSGQDERNQFLWGQAAYFSWQVTMAAIAAMAVVMSVLDCTAGIIAAAALFGVHVLSYFIQLSRLSQKF